MSPHEDSNRHKRPVHRKVYAATAGAGSGGLLGTLVVWLLGVFVFGGSHDAAHVATALASVPYPVSEVVPVVLSTVGALAFGYKAQAE